MRLPTRLISRQSLASRSRSAEDFPDDICAFVRLQTKEPKGAGDGCHVIACIAERIQRKKYTYRGRGQELNPVLLGWSGDSRDVEALLGCKPAGDPFCLPTSASSHRGRDQPPLSERLCLLSGPPCGSLRIHVRFPGPSTSGSISFDGPGISLAHVTHLWQIADYLLQETSRSTGDSPIAPWDHLRELGWIRASPSEDITCRFDIG